MWLSTNCPTHLKIVSGTKLVINAFTHELPQRMLDSETFLAELGSFSAQSVMCQCLFWGCVSDHSKSFNQTSRGKEHRIYTSPYSFVMCYLSGLLNLLWSTTSFASWNLLHLSCGTTRLWCHRSYISKTCSFITPHCEMKLKLRELTK